MPFTSWAAAPYYKVVYWIRSREGYRPIGRAASSLTEDATTSRSIDMAKDAEPTLKEKRPWRSYFWCVTVTIRIACTDDGTGIHGTNHQKSESSWANSTRVYSPTRLYPTSANKFIHLMPRGGVANDMAIYLRIWISRMLR